MKTEFFSILCLPASVQYNIFCDVSCIPNLDLTSLIVPVQNSAIVKHNSVKAFITIQVEENCNVIYE